MDTPYRRLAVLIYRILIDPLVTRLRTRIVTTCRELEMESILDIACATGAQCRRLGAAGIRATGIDLSEGMIDEARRAGGSASYVCGSAYELPFDDATFDASLLSLALHEHTESERRLMLREAIRVVRPGGALIVADYRRPPRPRTNPAWWMICTIERLAGGTHTEGFLDFTARGSLDGLLARHGLYSENVLNSYFGAIGIAIVPIEAADQPPT